jgi:molecular chaperone DnaK
MISKLLRSIIGRNFSDPRLREDIQSLPYEIVERNNTPQIKVGGFWREKLYTPEQVYSFIFRDLKCLAEMHLNETVQSVVVTVPTYFNEDQKEAIKNSAAMAGLGVIRILRESIATGEAYWGREEECILVFYHHGEVESYAVVMDYYRGVYDTLAVVRESDVYPEG